MHLVYVIANGGGPEAYVRTFLPWFEAKKIQVSIVGLGPLKDFPKNVLRKFSRLTPLHYFLSKLPNPFRRWASMVRAYEQEVAIWRQLKKIEKLKPIDLVEVTEGLPLAILPKFWKVVVRAHGSDWTFYHFCKDGKENISKKIYLESKQLRRAAAVSPLSLDLAQHLSEFCRFPKEKMEVLPYPIDIKKFIPAREEPAEPALMVVGRLEKRKGTDVLFHAMNQVWAVFPKVKIYVLGSESGLTQKNLLDLIPSGKHSQVIFPGFVPWQDLPAYYQKTTLYVAPTQYETFGYTILEAMACGLPVVSCRVGAVPELIEDGVHGYLVSYGDSDQLANKIVSLLSDRQKCIDMGRSAREKALQYDLDSVGEKTLRFYENACRQGKVSVI